MAGNSMRSDIMLMISSCIVILLIFLMADVFGPGPPEASYALPTPPPEEPGYIFEPVELASETGSTSEGSSTEVTFLIEGSNVVGVLVILDWVDDYGDNDQFTLTVVIGGQERGSVSGTSGHLELELNDTPDGEHSVVIEATKCPGLLGRRLLPLDIDRGNDWSMAVTGIEKVPEVVEGGSA